MSIYITNRPSHDWHRHHPLAKRIAAELIANPGVLNLRTRCLKRDIQKKYAVSDCTAATAVALARKAA